LVLLGDCPAPFSYLGATSLWVGGRRIAQSSNGLFGGGCRPIFFFFRASAWQMATRPPELENRQSPVVRVPKSQGPSESAARSGPRASSEIQHLGPGPWCFSGAPPKHGRSFPMSSQWDRGPPLGNRGGGPIFCFAAKSVGGCPAYGGRHRGLVGVRFPEFPHSATALVAGARSILLHRPWLGVDHILAVLLVDPASLLRGMKFERILLTGRWPQNACLIPSPAPERLFFQDRPMKKRGVDPI